jgi:hypothetical protein
MLYDMLDVILRLRQYLISLPISFGRGVSSSMSLREWLSHAARVYESIRKSSVILDYGRELHAKACGGSNNIP